MPQTSSLPRQERARKRGKRGYLRRILPPLCSLPRRGGDNGDTRLQRLLLLFPFLLLAGCRRATTEPDRFDLVIGSKGHTAGKFNRPRGIAVDSSEKILFVVDWDGRIQKFSEDGTFRASWIMPDIEKGKPEDLCLSRDGNLLVADTHYSRIVAFSPNGDLLRSWGSYGTDPGQFIYPVGICTDDEGCIYVSEYGENDRVQKFSPAGEFISSWGGFGIAPGQFQRPSGIDVSPKGIIWVADAVNHRIQAFDKEGKLLRVIGKEGTGPGEFRYPYDLAATEEAIYVLEYGNHRVQKLTSTGEPMETFGGLGTGEGRFVCPWRCALMEGRLVVSDTDNCRVVRLGAGF